MNGLLKTGALTAWLCCATWFFQSHFAGRAEAARESVQRAQTEAVLTRYDSQAIKPQVANNAKTVIEADGPALQAADKIDHAVRRLGLDGIRLAVNDRQSLYWTVFELVRRGYTMDEILVLLGHPGNPLEGC